MLNVERRVIDVIKKHVYKSDILSDYGNVAPN